ncbi:unnamed protein product [Notodromas monacha]|uniref:Uncharacterized protein n=1 Tax=Notodromas monacha TaxID=399045 RepID=A0A7R9BGM4_9CRUS|nr:unnamed protein product [Notodromas monacha]CAG0913756.1 unnamed protein product [Notodromas monacha]
MSGMRTSSNAVGGRSADPSKPGRQPRPGPGSSRPPPGKHRIDVTTTRGGLEFQVSVNSAVCRGRVTPLIKISAVAAGESVTSKTSSVRSEAVERASSLPRPRRAVGCEPDENATSKPGPRRAKSPPKPPVVIGVVPKATSTAVTKRRRLPVKPGSDDASSSDQRTRLKPVKSSIPTVTTKARVRTLLKPNNLRAEMKNLPAIAEIRISFGAYI